MSWDDGLIHVVVGILINSEQHVLIAERPPHKYCPGLWEFPGGKVENHETPFQALRREFLEEIGIDIAKADPWFQVSHSYPDRDVLLDVWIIKDFLGEAEGLEGQKIKWCKIDSLGEFQFPSGNAEIIKKLKQVAATL